MYLELISSDIMVLYKFMLVHIKINAHMPTNFGPTLSQIQNCDTISFYKDPYFLRGDRYSYDMATSIRKYLKRLGSWYIPKKYVFHEFELWIN